MFTCNWICRLFPGLFSEWCQQTSCLSPRRLFLMLSKETGLFWVDLWSILSLRFLCFLSYWSPSVVRTLICVFVQELTFSVRIPGKHCWRGWIQPVSTRSRKRVLLQERSVCEVPWANGTGQAETVECVSSSNVSLQLASQGPLLAFLLGRCLALGEWQHWAPWDLSACQPLLPAPLAAF